MNESYCNYCWAKLVDGCLCTEVAREIHCKAARERESKALQQKEATSSRKESRALKDYLKYVSQRIDYLKAFGSEDISNEYKYYVALKASLRAWGSKHQLFYKYLQGKLHFTDVQDLYGVSSRECARIFRSQRKQLLKYISAQEERLIAQYPHTNTDLSTEVSK